MEPTNSSGLNNLFIIRAKLDRKGNKTKNFKNFFHKTLENIEKSCTFAQNSN